MDFDTIEKLRKNYPTRLTRGRAIKLYCKLLCCAGDTKSWTDCSFKACFLWNFRMGREMLGNQTSFKKHMENYPIFKKINDSTAAHNPLEQPGAVK